MKRSQTLSLLATLLLAVTLTGCGAALKAGAGALVKLVKSNSGPAENQLASQAQTAISIMWGQAGSQPSPLQGTYRLAYRLQDGSRDTLYMRTLSQGSTLLQQTSAGRVVAGHWLRGVAARSRQHLQQTGKKGKVEPGKTFPALMVALPRQERQDLQWYNTIVGVFPQPPASDTDSMRVAFQAHHRFVRELGRARQGRTNNNGPLLPGWLAHSDQGVVRGRQGRSWGEHSYQLIIERTSSLAYSTDVP